MTTSHPTDYDTYAPTYAWARSAVPWVLEPLARSVAELPSDATVMEAGCGTGNYVCALAALRPELAWIGFDLSDPMFAEARTRSTNVRFIQADATDRFPARNGECSLVFAVDVVHHLGNLERFFQESRRVLAPAGLLLIVTDSEQTMRDRSLTRFFPEILTLEQKRYPDPTRLQDAARAAGLELRNQEHAVGDIPLTNAFVRQLEAKCSSAMRLLPAHVHEAGMGRVRSAQAAGEAWRSHYLVLHYAVTRSAAA